MDKRFTDLGQRPVKDLTAAAPPREVEIKTPGQRAKDLGEFVLHAPDEIGRRVGDAVHGAGNKAMGVDENQPKPLTPEQEEWNKHPAGDPHAGQKSVPKEMVDYGAETAKEAARRVAEEAAARAADTVAPGAGEAYKNARRVDELAHTGEVKDSRYIKN